LDASSFIKSTSPFITLLLVYVDDVIFAGNNLSEFTSIKAVLHEAFKIKDLGQLKYFMGLDLLNGSYLLGSKPVSTPSDLSIKLHNDSSPPLLDIPTYRRLIGKLLYLNTTRPDITYITQQLSQFLSNHAQTHHNAAMRILRYLKGCHGRGLFFRRQSSLQIKGYIDARWAGCKDTRRSISSQCFFLGQSLISCRTKKQLTVSRSSIEVEYRDLASATCELQWLIYLIRDLEVQAP